MLSRLFTLLVVDDASGNSNVIKILPSSSSGIKPVGLFLNSTNVATYIRNRPINTYLAAPMLFLTPSEYDAVIFRNHWLNFRKYFAGPFGFLLMLECFKSKRHKAGVSDRATNAEINTDIAMVIANC